MSTTAIAGAVTPTQWRLVLVELRKTIDTRAGRWLLGLIAVVALGTVVIFLFVGNLDDARFSDFLYASQVPVIFLLPVLGILTMTGEWSQRTALTTFALVPHRGRVLTAKLLGLLLLALTLVVLSILTALVITLIAQTGGASWGPLIGPIGRVALFGCLTVFVGAAFGLVFLNTPVALVSFFILPSLITALVSLFAALRGPAMWIDVNANLTHLLGDGLTGTIWARIAVSTLIWGVVLYVIGSVRVQRRDIA
jgi:ABC-2 type transport system permease protein